MRDRKLVKRAGNIHADNARLSGESDTPGRWTHAETITQSTDFAERVYCKNYISKKRKEKKSKGEKNNKKRIRRNSLVK